MRVQTKLMLSTFPILFGGFILLTLLSFSTASQVMRSDGYHYIGMELIEVQHIWTKGGSIRVTVQLAGGPRKASPDVARFIAEENSLGVDQPP